MSKKKFVSVPTASIIYYTGNNVRLEVISRAGIFKNRLGNTDRISADSMDVITWVRLAIVEPSAPVVDILQMDGHDMQIARSYLRPVIAALGGHASDLFQEAETDNVLSIINETRARVMKQFTGDAK